MFGRRGRSDRYTWRQEQQWQRARAEAVLDALCDAPVASYGGIQQREILHGGPSTSSADVFGDAPGAMPSASSAAMFGDALGAMPSTPVGPSLHGGPSPYGGQSTCSAAMFGDALGAMPSTLESSYGVDQAFEVLHGGAVPSTPVGPSLHGGPSPYGGQSTSSAAMFGDAPGAMPSTPLRPEATSFLPAPMPPGDTGAAVEWIGVPVWRSQELLPVSWYGPYVLLPTDSGFPGSQARVIAERYLLDTTPWPCSRNARDVFCSGFYHQVLPHLVGYAGFAENVQRYLRENQAWSVAMTERVASLSVEVQGLVGRLRDASAVQPVEPGSSLADRIAMMDADVQRLSRRVDELALRLVLLENDQRWGFASGGPSPCTNVDA